MITIRFVGGTTTPRTVRTMTERTNDEPKLSVLKRYFTESRLRQGQQPWGTSDNVIAIRQTSFFGKLRKPRNNDVRSREHLTPSEVARLIKPAKETGRHGHRDSTMILIAFRHGLRVSELMALPLAPGGPRPRQAACPIVSKAARPPHTR